MNIQDIDVKIAEQQGIIIEAEAKLRAWFEVREAFAAQPANKKKRKSPSRNSGITKHIYAVLPSMKKKFTSADVVEAVKKRLGGNADRKDLSTAVCSFLHSTTSGAYKQPKYPLKVCGKRDGIKLYTKK
jgi:hypothetical protein